MTEYPLAPQLAHNLGDFVFLEDSNSGNTRPARIYASVRVFQSDSPQGNDWDLLLAGVSQKAETCGLDRRLRLFLFKYRPEYSEVGAVPRRNPAFGHGMTCNANNWVCSPWCYAVSPNPSNIVRRDVMRAQVHSMGTTRDSYIRPRIDQQTRRDLATGS